MNTVNTIFNDLKDGTTVGPQHPQIKYLREASYAIIRLLQRLNASSNPEEIKKILSEITGSPIDETVAIFPLWLSCGGNNESFDATSTVFG